MTLIFLIRNLIAESNFMYNGNGLHLNYVIFHVRILHIIFYLYTFLKYMDDVIHF